MVDLRPVLPSPSEKRDAPFLVDGQDYAHPIIAQFRLALQYRVWHLYLRSKQALRNRPGQVGKLLRALICT